MSKSVVIEVTRGPVVESGHEGIAAVVKPDGTVVASWGDIDSLILPKILDEILTLGGSYVIKDIRIGQRQNDPSHARIEVRATRFSR